MVQIICVFSVLGCWGVSGKQQICCLARKCIIITVKWFYFRDEAVHGQCSAGPGDGNVGGVGSDGGGGGR